MAYVYGCVQRPSRSSCSSGSLSTFNFNVGDNDCCDISCRFACNTPQLRNYQVFIATTGRNTRQFTGSRPITQVQRTFCFTEVTSFRVRGQDLNLNTLPTTILDRQVEGSTLQLQPSPPQSPATASTTASTSSEPPMTTIGENGTASREPTVTTDSGNATVTDTTSQPETNPSSADYSETGIYSAHMVYSHDSTTWCIC